MVSTLGIILIVIGIVVLGAMIAVIVVQVQYTKKRWEQSRHTAKRKQKAAAARDRPAGRHGQTVRGAETTRREGKATSA